MARVADVPVGEHRVRRGRAISSFAERVRGRRLGLGLTRAALAAAAGIAHDTLLNVERGRHEPRAYTLGRLAAALGTTMDALWHGDAARVGPGAGGHARPNPSEPTQTHPNPCEVARRCPDGRRGRDER